MTTALNSEEREESVIHQIDSAPAVRVAKGMAILIQSEHLPMNRRDSVGPLTCGFVVEVCVSGVFARIDHNDLVGVPWAGFTIQPHWGASGRENGQPCFEVTAPASASVLLTDESAP